MHFVWNLCSRNLPVCLLCCQVQSEKRSFKAIKSVSLDIRWYFWLVSSILFVFVVITCCFLLWLFLFLQFNPFTPQACKISGLKSARIQYMPENSIFDCPVTNLLSVLCILIDVLSHAYVKGGRSLNDFKFGTFIGRFPAWQWKG